MEQKISQQLADILQFLDQVQKDYTWSQSELVRLDGLCQDYLHMIELQDHDYHNRAKFATALRQCRIKRRIHKDNISFSEPLVTLLSNEKGKLINLTTSANAWRCAQSRAYCTRPTL